LTEVIRNLSKAGAGLNQPLLIPREPVRTVGLVVVTADRGLCGGYNANVERAAEQAINRERANGRDYEVFVTGKKGESFFRYRRFNLANAFTGFSELPTYEDARAVAREVVQRYESGEIDQVQLIYSQFLSLGTQRVLERRFVPMDASAITEMTEADTGGSRAAYEFEPSPEAIL